KKEAGEDWRPSDQYAAGITLYELLSRGDFPLDFGDDSLTSCCRAHLTSPVKPLAVPECPNRSFPGLDAVIGRMLDKAPRARYPNIARCKIELVFALARYGLYKD